jgi:hypothetical protein
MYLRTIEDAYVEGELVREQAISALGAERVAELDYAMGAIAQDIERGLRL